MALEGGASAYAVARKGAILIRILYVSTSDAVDVDALGALLEQQYALLP